MTTHGPIDRHRTAGTMLPTIRVVEFQVPLPPRDLSSNGAHGHWSTTSKARKDYRSDTMLSYSVAFSPFVRSAHKPMVRAKLSLVFCTKGSRKVGLYGPQDEANAVYAAKSLIDGLVDAGLIEGDDHKRLTLESCRIDNTRGPFVVVRLESTE